MKSQVELRDPKRARSPSSARALPTNPTASVRGPRHIVKKGKMPVLTAEEARQMLDSIGRDWIDGLRDRALIGVMYYSFARVSAAVGMNVEDYGSDHGSGCTRSRPVVSRRRTTFGVGHEARVLTSGKATKTSHKICGSAIAL